MHVDIDIEVDPLQTVSEAHVITQHVRAQIQTDWPAVRDVVVHVEPYFDGDHLSRQPHGADRVSLEPVSKPGCACFRYLNPRVQATRQRDLKPIVKASASPAHPRWRFVRSAALAHRSRVARVARDTLDRR